MPEAKEKKPKKQKPLTEMEKTVLAYAQTAKELGCPREQVENFFKAQIFLQPKQLEFAAACRLCDTPDGPNAVMFGGGRGSAKTHAALAQVFADDCQRFPGLKCLVLRKVGKANKEQINDYRNKLLKFLPHKYKEQDGWILFENGSRVLLGHFKDEKDIDQYMGQEYDLISIAESNQLTFSKKKFILTCLRTSKQGWRPRLYEDTNPGGVGMAENKQMYVTPWKKGEQKQTRYIHTTVYDNKFVNADYITQLESLRGWQRKAWLEGDWDFAAGSFFTNFDTNIHVYPNEHVQLDERTITRWFASMDYGFSHPNCFHLHCEDDSGTIYTVGEYHANETIIQDHAANFRDLLRLHNLNVEDLEFIAAGHDCFRVDKDGSTVATEYSENGIILTRVQIDRINAWSQMQERMGAPDKGIRPTWYIHHSCINLIDQIPLAQYDPKRPGDILKWNANPEDGSGGDDALEGARLGLVMSYSSLLKTAKPIQMGNYKTLSDTAVENDTEERGEILLEQEYD